MSELKKCPFCGGKFKLIPLDDEFNIHEEDGYEKDPWSGIQYGITHEESQNEGCPIATHDGEILGIFGYDTKEEAIEALNTRKPMDKIVEQLEMTADAAHDEIMARQGSEQYYDGYGDGVNAAITIIKEEGGI